MGIDASAVSDALPKGWLVRLSGPKTLLALRAAAQVWADAQQLGPLFKADVLANGGLEVTVVPVADPVTFEVRAGRITVHFRSSNTGPGYHAAVVEMLDHQAKALGIKSSWLASDGTGLDETGYAVSRDFGGLQVSMAGFLPSLGQTIPPGVAGDEKAALAFCVPMGLGQEDGLVACPLGFKPLAWAKDLRALDAQQSLAKAFGFFIWWDKGLGPAVTDSDHLVQRQIAHSRAKLTALGADLPADLAEALDEYDSTQTNDSPPKLGGIGYCKRLIRAQIFKSWAIRWPGYSYAVDNGKNTAREHPGLWLGAMALTLDFKVDEPGAFEWPELSEGPVREIRSGVFARKTARRKLDNGAGTQAAFVISQREDRLEPLVLTLSSAVDWPYDEFDAWIGTVTCPDLPDSPPATKH